MLHGLCVGSFQVTVVVVSRSDTLCDLAQIPHPPRACSIAYKAGGRVLNVWILLGMHFAMERTVLTWLCAVL